MSEIALISPITTESLQQEITPLETIVSANIAKSTRLNVRNKPWRAYEVLNKRREQERLARTTTATAEQLRTLEKIWSAPLTKAQEIKPATAAS
jgi:hypothetical protein